MITECIVKSLQSELLMDKYISTKKLILKIMNCFEIV